ncbi:pre-mRNA-splicing factor RSE1, partial [Thraustotheca clavata]
DKMHLMNLTLQEGGAITDAVYGNFCGTKSQDIVCSSGSSLRLYQTSTANEAGVKQLQLVHSINVFGVVRSLLPFRLTGGVKDYLVVGTDSGKITVLEFMVENCCWEVRHSETFGKTGCRRITPGQYLAADPKGRAIMIGSVEKQKLVYIMNRDASSRLTISSPLEAHRSNAIHFDIVGIDVGFENPIFATLEIDYADHDNGNLPAKDAVKNLVYYELDLGLNHVTRRWSEPVERSANKLIPVPGGSEGPGGVLVCSEGWITYKNENHAQVPCRIPQRYHSTDSTTPIRNDLLIVATATHKQRDLFFVIVQSELGDLYKVTLVYNGSEVSAVKIKYFDTLPTAVALCITKTGFLFSASEYATHYLCQFQSIGDNDETAECVSFQEYYPMFNLRRLTNLAIVDTIDSLSPITQLLVEDLANEHTPQMYALCGRGNRSTLRVLRHGLSVTEVAASSLPGVAKAVWCLKQSEADLTHKYIVVSFDEATLVLEVGDSVEEVTTTGLAKDVGSLLVVVLADDSILQIHRNGFNHVRQYQRVTQFKAPGKKVIEKCTANSRQVVLSMAGGTIIYFELSAAGELVEKGRIDHLGEISSLDVGEVPEGRQRFPFLAVGTYDGKVRILNLDPQNMFSDQTLLATPDSHPHTLCFSMLQFEPHTDTNGGHALFLSIGLENGVMQQSRIDPLTAKVLDTRTRFLGVKPVKLFRILVQGKNAVLGLSSRCWLSYFHGARRQLTPLSCEPLTYASVFISEQCPEGIVAVAQDELKILTLDALGDVFNQQTIALKYTPRKAIVHPLTRRLLILEADHNSLNDMENATLGFQAVIPKPPSDDDDEEDDTLSNLTFMHPPIPAEAGTWTSQLRIVDPTTLDTLLCHAFDPNERALSLSTCVFHDRGGETFLIVGTVKNMLLHSPSGVGYLRVYRLMDTTLVLVHVTELDGIPYAMCEFQGRLLVSLGKILRIYDLGKKKMLRKCENRSFPSNVTGLTTAGSRIYCSDSQSSFHYVRYRHEDNQLVIFADDFVPRTITASALLDYDTMAGGDKFGNVFVTRLPSEVSDEIENPSGSRILWDSHLLNGAPNKVEQICQFHVGEAITSMVRTRLVPVGMEAIVYTTIMGRIGALIPFSSREDIDFATHLEMYMRQEAPPLCGRDHLSYRSYFIPVKDVADGDLCEQFGALPNESQLKVAQDLDRTPLEVLKKLEDIRNRLL